MVRPRDSPLEWLLLRLAPVLLAALLPIVAANATTGLQLKPDVSSVVDAEQLL